MAVHDLAELRDRERVFRDRGHAGDVLRGLLVAVGPVDPVVLAIPAGGVPVAVPIATGTGWPLDVAVVSKVTLPWNSESGYGAVAFDGSEQLNDELVRAVGLRPEQVREGVETTRRKVQHRVKRLRGSDAVPDVSGRTAILVDDGLASGFTMLVAVAAVRRAGAARVVVAVPTGAADTVERLASEVDELVCANVRRGRPFAVADAYERWHDVVLFEAEELLARR